jgi:hypothetical protein
MLEFDFFPAAAQSTPTGIWSLVTLTRSMAAIPINKICFGFCSKAGQAFWRNLPLESRNQGFTRKTGKSPGLFEARDDRFSINYLLTPLHSSANMGQNVSVHMAEDDARYQP